jgi:hypothetical protein
VIGVAVILLCVPYICPSVAAGSVLLLAFMQSTAAAALLAATSSWSIVVLHT